MGGDSLTAATGSACAKVPNTVTPRWASAHHRQLQHQLQRQLLGTQKKKKWGPLVVAPHNLCLASKT